MKTDLIFPSGNENELVEMGEKLGFERLIFVYSSPEKIKKIKGRIQIDYAVLIREKNKKNLVRSIDKIRQKGYLVLVEAGDDDFNRFVLERTRAEMIFGLEGSGKRDKTHYRRSGLDQILCKIAAEKDKVIVFDFKKIINPIILGRTAQNLRFCRKYKVRFILGSFGSGSEEMKSEHDLSLFLRLLQQKFL